MNIFHFTETNVECLASPNGDSKPSVSPTSPLSPTKSPDYTTGNTSPKMPPPDPGNLLDLPSVTDYLSFHSNTESSSPEVCAGCVDALIVYAAEADKKKSKFKMKFTQLSNAQYYLGYKAMDGLVFLPKLKRGSTLMITEFV